MTEMDHRPKFADTLASQAMGTFVEKKLFGRKFVRGSAMLKASGFLFQTGAELGAFHRQRLHIFLVPFDTEAGHVDSSAKWGAEEALRIHSSAADASGVQELFMISEMRRKNPTSPPGEWTRWLASRAEEKWPPQDAVAMGTIYTSVGAGYGAHYPAEFAELYSSEYGQIDPIDWKRAYDAGAVGQPKPPDFLSLEDSQRNTAADFLDFCREYYPELIDALSA